VQIPIHGYLQHNAGFLVSIGGLVVNWANNESVFLAMLQCLVGGGKHTAAIIWHSQRTTRGRLDLVARLVREQVNDTELVEQIDQAINQFAGLSRVRNFFCHAMYDYDPEMRLLSATSVNLTPDGYPIESESKKMDRATLNEIKDAAMKLADTNLEQWRLVIRLQRALGVQHAKPPPLPADALRAAESRLPKDEPSEPK